MNTLPPPPRLLQVLRALANDGLNLIFPPRCIHCARAGWLLCPACAQLVQPVGAQICAQCGRPQSAPIKQCAQCQLLPTSALQIVRIAALHSTPLREAIHALKYADRRELAVPLARYLVATAFVAPWRATAAGATPIDGVIPIPLHQARQAARGYNQAELLAQAFCLRMQLPLRTAWLTRQRSTHSQVGLSAVERRANVDDAFAAPAAVYGKRLLLIDDVYTTGATMQACAAALSQAGAAAVYGLALACPQLSG